MFSSQRTRVTSSHARSALRLAYPDLEAAAAALTIGDVSTFQKNLLREADLEYAVDEPDDD